MTDYAYSLAVKEANELVSRAFNSSLGISLADARISPSKNAELGDLASSACFEHSKTLKANPVQLAEKVASAIQLPSGSLFEKVSAVNGFVNFSYSTKFYSMVLQEVISQGEHFGDGDSGKGKTAVIEFSSPNIGKPMHIGHIRSTILGDALVRLYRKNGYTVLGTNFLCEAGAQTAKLLLAVQRFGGAKLENEKDLLALYVNIHKELEAHPELDLEVKKLIEGMESGDAVVMKSLKEVRKISVAPFKRNYKLLGVKFDKQVFDSDYVKWGKRLVKAAVKAKLAFKDEHGETVGNLEPLGLPNLVVLRSNGTTLYSTRDLGLAYSDYRKYHYDLRLVVTASEQNLHFRQVFALLKALNEPYAANLRHLGFGLIFLEEGRISTRKGQVLLLEEVLEDAVAYALSEVKTRQHYSEKQQAKIAHAVGVAALKYTVLRTTAEKDITFKLSEAVKFDGNTAAYLQYNCVRAKNVFRKGKIKNLPQLPEDYEYTAGERHLLSLLAGYPALLASSAPSLSVHAICEYAFKVATAFSLFYASSPVLKAETEEAKAARLNLVKAAETVLENSLEILGIEVPERM